MIKLLLLVAVLLIMSSQPAFGQFLDPDRCLTCHDKRDHAAFAMAGDVAAGVIFHKPWQRLAVVGSLGVLFELGALDAELSKPAANRCTPGLCFGLLDLAADMTGAVVSELLIHRLMRKSRKRRPNLGLPD